MSKSITYIAVSAIEASPMNPRKSFDEAALAELAQSITELGVLQPIIVRSLDAGYQLVCGERRWRASQIAKLKTIPAIIRTLTDEEAMDLAITENLQRKDVSPIEEARAFKYLSNNGKGIDELCARFGKSESYVRNRIKLLYLTPYFTIRLEKGEISHSVAQVVARFDIKTQQKIEERFDRNYEPWSKFNAKTLDENIKSSFLPNISHASFDTSDCAKCVHNSANQSLFADAETPCCMWYSCYNTKYEIWKAQQAVKLAAEYGLEKVYIDGDFDALAREVLTSHNFEIIECCAKDINSMTSIPDNHIVEYYLGGVEMGVAIFPAGLFAVVMAPGERPLKNNNTTTNVIQQKNNLLNKITRERELKNEKAITEVNEYIKALDFTKMYDVELLPTEETLAMFALINSLSYEAQRVLAKEIDSKGEYSILESELWDLATLITSDKPSEGARRGKAFVFRLIIEDKLLRHSPCLIADKLFDWVDAHNPGTTYAIKMKHEDIFSKRKSRLEQRIAELENGKK